MAQSFMNIFKKESAENESAEAQSYEVKDSAKVSEEEAPENGKHGEDFCCGSCS
ncbi:CCGSCS motif protein [Marinobacter sp.]|uniref:CCGSCS motif protein n=1 Tax=Marinobacter sp. TaxID=50741 RepID=UPI003566E962